VVVLVGSVLMLLTKWPHSAESRRMCLIGVLLSVVLFVVLTQVWAFDHGQQCRGDGNMVSTRFGGSVVGMIPLLLSLGFGATALSYPSRSTVAMSRGVLSRMFLLVGLTYLGSGFPFFGC